MRTLAFGRISLLTLALVVSIIPSVVRAEGNFAITGQSRAVYCDPLGWCVNFGLPAHIDVYSDRGVLVAQNDCTNGYVQIDGLKPGTYNLVGTSLTTFIPIINSNGFVTGSYTTATAAVTVRNKNTPDVDLVFYVIPDP